jgi:predicted nucleic acid-binding protein
MINQNNYLEKLKEISNECELKLFKKKRNKWILKDTRIIMNECNKLKKKKVKELSTNLKNNTNSDEIKNINNKTLSDIDTLDNIIHIVKNNNDNYIECFSN